ncbi:MAG: hypothetical protein ACFUZC_14855 [Chthoniobacteraceae bacterium]
MKPLFHPGRVYATRGALALAKRNRSDLLALVSRHVLCDPGTLGDADRQANLDAIKYGGRVFSSYLLAGKKVWVITEADRNATTILLPSEY